MAESLIYRASLASVVAVNAQGGATALGVVQNVQLQKDFVVEGVPEVGSFQWGAILLHGYSGRFSWGKAWTKGQDMIAQGLAPADASIATFQPFVLRIIDQEAQRQIALVYQGVMEMLGVTADARAKLLQNVSGICISLLWESEL